MEPNASRGVRFHNMLIAGKMGNTKKPTDPVSARMRAQIDENLRRVYAANLSEDIPDRFKDLLSKLRAAGQKPTSGKG